MAKMSWLHGRNKVRWPCTSEQTWLLSFQVCTSMPNKMPLISLVENFYSHTPWAWGSSSMHISRGTGRPLGTEENCLNSCSNSTPQESFIIHITEDSSFWRLTQKVLQVKVSQRDHGSDLLKQIVVRSRVKSWSKDGRYSPFSQAHAPHAWFSQAYFSFWNFFNIQYHLWP